MNKYSIKSIKSKNKKKLYFLSTIFFWLFLFKLGPQLYSKRSHLFIMKTEENDRKNRQNAQMINPPPPPKKNIDNDKNYPSMELHSTPPAYWFHNTV